MTRPRTPFPSRKMKSLFHRFVGLAALGLVWLVAGCDPAKPPAPVGVAEIPHVLTEAFRDAAGAIRASADAVVASVQAKEWASASVGLEALAGEPALTARQRNEVARCLIAVNTQVADAAAAGDAQAAQLQQVQRADK